MSIHLIGCVLISFWMVIFVITLTVFPSMQKKLFKEAMLENVFTGDVRPQVEPPDSRLVFNSSPPAETADITQVVDHEQDLPTVRQDVDITKLTGAEVKVESTEKYHQLDTCRILKSMVYWDIDEEEKIFKKDNSKEEKYILFQPDLGGWNNIRMGMEVVFVLAHAMQRTLVLPPRAMMYLLHKNKKNVDNKSSLEDFMNFKQLGKHIKIISMPEYLQHQIDLAKLDEKRGDGNRMVVPVPNDDITLNGKDLWKYLNSSSYVRLSQPGKTFLAFNISTPSGQSIREASEFTYSTEFRETSRLSKFMMKRQLVPYYHPNVCDPLATARSRIPSDADRYMYSDCHPSVYLPGGEENRLLTHFYGYIYFAKVKQHNYYIRWVRNNIRYDDSIFCVSSLVVADLLRIVHQTHVSLMNTVWVKQLLNEAPKIPPKKQDISQRPPPVVEHSVGSAGYVSLHIRRGDFAHKNHKLPAKEIMKNIFPLIFPEFADGFAEDQTVEKLPMVYIATDEGDRNFFDPFYQYFEQIRFMNDFASLINLPQLNQNQIGMIEQLICAQADVFIGTPLSTFTGYITRLRAYLSTTNSGKSQLPLYSKYLHTYYFTPKHMYQLHSEPTLRLPFWPRDFDLAFAYQAEGFGLNDDEA